MKHTAHVILDYGVFAIPVEHLAALQDLVKMSKSWDSATNKYEYKVDRTDIGLTLLTKDQVGVILATEKLE